MRKALGKRLWTAVLAMFVLLALLPEGQARAETKLATGYVSSTTLNMRPDASTHQAVVAVLKRGDVVNVYEICGTWLRIDVPALNKSGYVSGKYITLDTTTGFYGLGLTTGTVHVRAKNTAESESKGVVSGNTGLTLLQMEGNGWWKVKTHGDGLEGYIAKKLVKVICKAAKSASAADSKGSAASINAEGVNLRSGPSTKDKSLGLLKKGTSITVISTSGSWCKVKVTSSGKTGYVYKSFVKQSAAKATPTPKASSSASSAKGAPGYINASEVNLRTSNSTKSKSLGKLKKNTVLEVLSTKGDWCEIRVVETKKTGYVAKRYVTLSSATPAQTATSAPTATPVPTASPTPTATPVPTATPTPAGAGA